MRSRITFDWKHQENPIVLRRCLLSQKDRLHTQRRVLLGAGVHVMQKLASIDFIATYAPEMFTLAGYGGDKPALLAGGKYISYTASLALAIYLTARFGRRKLMLAAPE